MRNTRGILILEKRNEFFFLFYTSHVGRAMWLKLTRVIFLTDGIFLANGEKTKGPKGTFY